MVWGEDGFSRLYLNGRPSLSARQVRLVGGVGQAGEPTDVAAGASALGVTDRIPGEKKRK